MTTAPTIEQPESRVPVASSLCSTGLSPQVLTGILLQLLRSQFSDLANIQNPVLHRKLEDLGMWTKNSSTGVLIETSGHWTPDKAQKRPAIIIHRLDLNDGSRLIGDQAGDDALTGRADYLGFWSGAHVVACCSNDPAEAEIFGWEVAQFLRRFCPLFVESYGFHRCRIVKVGQYQELKFTSKETNQHVGVPVIMAYSFQDSWSVTPDAPYLKHIAQVNSL